MVGSGGLCEYHVALWCILGQHVCSLEYAGTVGRLWYGSSSQNGAFGRWTPLCRHRDPGEFSVGAVPA